MGPQLCLDEAPCRRGVGRESMVGIGGIAVVAGGIVESCNPGDFMFGKLRPSN